MLAITDKIFSSLMFGVWGLFLTLFTAICSQYRNLKTNLRTFVEAFFVLPRLFVSQDKQHQNHRCQFLSQLQKKMLEN